MQGIWVLAAMAVCMVAFAAQDGGAEPGPTPVESPVSLIRNGDLSGPLEGNWSGGGERLKVSAVRARADEYRRAVRLQSDPLPGDPPWALGFGQPCIAPVQQGDAVYFRAWMRSPDRCRVSFIFEMATPPFTKCIAQDVVLTPQWKEYRFAGRAGRSFAAGGTQAKFFLGHGKGVVEIAGVRVENCGAAPGHRFDETIDYWGGREHPNTWRKAALARIERIRKGSLHIRVVDGAGRPVPGARVRVEQKRHHFRFGTCLPAGRLLAQDADSQRFRQEVARLYNTVTFENDLKWASMSPATFDVVGRACDWLKAHEIDLRGHCLLWGSYEHLAGPFQALRGPELLSACREHATDYATRMRGRLYLWDVVNEAGSNVAVWDDIGWGAFPESFRWARAADPQARLCYNDYGIVNESPAYRVQVAKRIRALLDAGVPVDVLGIQGHMALPLTPIHRVLEILDEWAAFGKDLEITEFDLGCPDDQAHAGYVRDMLTAAFSHPRMTAFIMWGFWEGSHWRANDGAAMFRRDWSKRPAQEAWEDLVLRQWSTRWEGRAGRAGTASLRAFYGRHEATVERQGKMATATVELTPGGEGVVEVRMP